MDFTHNCLDPVSGYYGSVGSNHEYRRNKKDMQELHGLP